MEQTVVDIDLRESEQYIVNIGPQHPSTHGVLRFELGPINPLVFYGGFCLGAELAPPLSARRIGTIFGSARIGSH